MPICCTISDRRRNCSALAEHISVSICANIARAVIAQRQGAGTAREVVDMAFDAFGKQGGGQLVSWMRMAGNDDALDAIIRGIHAIVEEVNEGGGDNMRHVTQTLVLLALGDALIGAPLSASLHIARDNARDMAERMVIRESEALGQVEAPAMVQLG
jgi:hypothetical protein